MRNRNQGTDVHRLPMRRRSNPANLPIRRDSAVYFRSLNFHDIRMFLRTSEVRAGRMVMQRTLLTVYFLANMAAAAIAAPDQTSTPQEALRSNPPNVYAITGAMIIAHPDATPQPATIVVRHGRIEAIGPDVLVPGDAKKISLNGKTICAGFIDAYSEQTIPTDRLNGSARYWNGQITPQLSVADQLPNNPDVESLRKQGFVAQLVAPADGVIKGRSALVSLTGNDLNSALLARDVAQHLRLTILKPSRDSYPGSPMGAVALARQAMYDAKWYCDAQAAFTADSSLPRPEQNDALAALQTVIDGSMPTIVTTSNEQFALRADRFAAEFGLTLIIKGSGNEYRRLPEIAATRRSLILPLAFPEPPNVATPEAAQDVTLESLLHWDIAPENPAKVDAAGIRFAFTTDRLASKDDFLKNLRKAVERGLSPGSALRALTVSPAQMLGVEEQLGTLEPGRIASFVVTDGDLFDKNTKIVETWIDGIRFEHLPDASQKIDGHFELQIAQAAEFPNRLYMELTQQDGKFKGRISRQPVPASVERVEKKILPTTEGKDTAVAQKPDAAEDASASKSKEILALEGVKLQDTAVFATFNSKDWGIDGVVRISLTLTEKQDDQEPKSDDQVLAIGSVTWPDGNSPTANMIRVEAPAEPEKTDEGKSEATEETEKDEETDGEKKLAQASFEINYPLGAFGRTEPPSVSAAVAFVHAKIWTCGPDGIIDDGTLLIEDGEIVAVGKDIKIPIGTAMIDAQGMHISPGIIDCHSHMATDGGVNESTQAITCEVRVGDFVDANDITIYRQLAGGVTVANILHGSANPIGGQNQVIKLRWGMQGEDMKFAEAPQGVKFALGENVKQSNWTNPTNRYPQTRMGVEQLFRDSFEAARDYARKMDAWQTDRRGLPPRRDLELEALREIVEGHRWIHCHSYRQDEILALLRILEEYDVTIGTFQHILEGYKVANEMTKHGAMASAFSDWWAYKFEVIDAIPHAGALMHNQGVVVSFNSDDNELARHLNQEAAKAIKYGGVPREEALKFVTLNPARQLRVEHLVGSLEPGKHADFVIWNGDPLSNFTRCEQTWIDGRRFFSRDDDAQMQEQALQKRNTLIQKILTSGEGQAKPGEHDSDPASLWPRYDEFCQHFKFQNGMK